MGDHGNPMMRNPNAGVHYHAKAQGRHNNVQLKIIAQNHPTGLTANLLRLFEPRPPLEYKPPAEKLELPAYSGIAQFVSQFAEPGDPEYATSIPKSETRAEKKSVSLSLNKVQPKLPKSFRSMTHKVTPMPLEIHTKPYLLGDLVMRHPSVVLKGSLKLMDLLEGYGL